MKWRATDLIDFEYLLHESSGKNLDDAGGDADRQIYQVFIENHPEPVSRRELFRYWLSRKREDINQSARDQGVLPGKAAAETLGLIRWIAGVGGALFGAGLCGSLLAYAGEHPINVFSCLWVMIAPQLVLLLLLGVSTLFRAVGPARAAAGIYPLLTGIFRRFIKKLIDVRYNNLSAARRTRIDTVTGMIGQSRSIYGPVLFRPIFIIGQVFGIFFNIGIIAVLLLRVTLTDLAFGWQSTLQPAADTVYRIVDLIALPWSWMVPDAIAHPTVSQIEGSQFVLKEGMRHLDNPDLAAWWPFFLLAILFYGLLPRLVVFAGTLVRQHRAIKRISFKHAACDRLLLAMKTPRVRTKSRAYEKPGDQLNRAEAASGLPASKKPETMAAEPLDAAIALIPEDISGQYPEEELRERLRLRLDLDIRASVTCSYDPDTDSRAIKQFLTGNGETAEIRVVVIQEAWQPPIQETLSWIASIRRNAGIEGGLIIGIIGKPGSSTIFTPPADTDRMIWEHAIANLGDPYIRVEILGEHPLQEEIY